MSQPSDSREALIEKIMGLGEKSVRKTYYPELKRRMDDLQRFRALLEEAHDLAFMLSCRKRTFIDINKSAAHFLAKEREEALLIQPEEIFDARTMEIIGAGGCSAPEPATYSYEGHLHGSGTTIPVGISVTLLEQHDARYALILCHDMSERQEREGKLRQAQAEIEESRLLLQSIIDTAMTPISYLDMEERYILANVAYAELVGAPASEFVGRRMAEVIPPDVYAQVKDPARHAACGRSSRFPMIWPDLKTGRMRHLIKECAPHVDSEGVIRGVVSTLSEVTELKEKEQALNEALHEAESADRAKGEFLANMTHEMRTPLAGVLGMIDLVLQMNVGSEEKELLETARRSGHSLLRLISDVLDFSRLKAGQMQFESVRFDLQQCISSAVETVSVRAREKGLSLECELSQTVPVSIVGDEGRLRQALVNLLGNAVKFTSRGGITIQVLRFRGQEEFLQFEVRDTGIGISEQDAAKIFSKFYQVDASSKRKYGGTGIGLTVTKEIVEMMGGTIWLESKAGVGTSFFIRIPLRDPEGEAEARSCAVRWGNTDG